MYSPHPWFSGYLWFTWAVRPSFRLSDGHGYHEWHDDDDWCGMLHVPGPGINYEYDSLGTLNKYQASEVSLTCWQQLSVDLHTHWLTQWHSAEPETVSVTDTDSLTQAQHSTGTAGCTESEAAVASARNVKIFHVHVQPFVLISEPSFQLRSFDSYGLPACSMLSLYFDHGSAAWRT